MHRRRLPLWMLIVQQLVLTGLVLCVFALFHHVLPRLYNRAQEPITQLVRTVPTPMPSAEAAPAEAQDELPPEAQEYVDPGPFTETRVETENGYTGPNLAFTLTCYDHPEKHPSLTYYAADVYVRTVEQIACAFPPKGTLFGDPLAIAEGAGAVLAVNGDNAIALADVFTVRNGALYNDAKTRGDVCVLYCDGHMEVYSPESYRHKDVLAAEPWQIWCFGPSLLDREGKPLKEFNIDVSLQRRHPRTVIGYYEPGHYCFVVIDGRGGDYSEGATIAETVEIMSELGCTRAYNLDGGASSMMIYRGELVNVPSRERTIKDMIVLLDLEEVSDEAA